MREPISVVAQLVLGMDLIKSECHIIDECVSSFLKDLGEDKKERAVALSATKLGIGCWRLEQAVFCVTSGGGIFYYLEVPDLCWLSTIV
ncbi:MAG: hypothetical protein KME28_25140 [Pelatocladus maniniholoensis HA4357-MV3]|uniref:Uncharacterized protein n=1 Tax=Pelatocladus maniniholoensis HA4357-MV3 TaxID=1117104 RepID=A0A9E3LV86_9NOST|nr:hypothetical protein [Pelatocladus maniniholoensis HA4357-MV3]